MHKGDNGSIKVSNIKLFLAVIFMICSKDKSRIYHLSPLWWADRMLYHCGNDSYIYYRKYLQHTIKKK